MKLEATESCAQIQRICKENGIHVSDPAFVLLQRYAELLIDWNTKVNLVSRNDIQNIWRSHILHSLSVLFFLKIESGTKILDLGTGGGLPGIPISIVRDDLEITLLDSVRKKTAAVQNIVNALSLANVNVITGRAEEIVQKNKGQWDIVISRAVAPLVQLMEWSKPLLKNSPKKKIQDFERRTWKTPVVIALKGGDIENEIREAKKKWNPVDIQVFDIVFDGAELGEMQSKKIVFVKP